MSAATDDVIVACFFPPKKLKSLPFLKEKIDGVIFHTIDYEEPWKFQEFFHILLHKASHDMVLAQSDPIILSRLKIIEKLAENSRSIVLDPFESVSAVTDREKICSLLQDLSFNYSFIHSPSYAVIQKDCVDKLEAVSELNFPFICKAIAACATNESHHMSIVMNCEELALVPEPFVVQEFINHGGCLYKVYVIGDHCSVHKRNSLSNIKDGTKTGIKFDTQKPYPIDKDQQINESIKEVTEEIALEAQKIAQVLSSTFKLTLFGFDLIQSEEDGRLFVVDLNFFPSYTELTNFPQLLRNHIINTWKNKSMN